MSGVVCVVCFFAGDEKLIISSDAIRVASAGVAMCLQPSLCVMAYMCTHEC